MSLEPPAPSTQPRICLLGEAAPAWLDGFRRALPQGVEPRVLAATSVRAALAELDAEAHRDTIFVRAGPDLPPHWYPRVAAALALPDVLALCVEADDAGDAPIATRDAARYLAGSRAAHAIDRIDAPLVALRAAAWRELPRTATGFDLAALAAPWQVVTMDDIAIGATATTNADADDPARGWPGLDGKPVLLHALHGWGGGAARWVDDFARADRAHHHLVLESHGDFRRRRHGESFTLRRAGSDGTPLRRFVPLVAIADSAVAHAGYRAFLDAVRSDFAVDAVLVSSLIGHAFDALATGLPTTLVVHDHYPLWPLLHRDFGDPSLPFDADQRAADLAACDHEFEFDDRSPEHWRRLRDGFVAAVVKAGARIVAPSASALAAELRLAPEFARLEQSVIAHGIEAWPARRAPQPPARDRLRLVVPGRVRRGKGAELLAAALPRLREVAEIVLLGAGAAGMDFFGQRDVHVVLDYQRDALPDLIETFAPDAALIVPTVAETFGYTLSEMRALALPVIATAVGALGQRIDDGVDGFLVAPDADAIVERIAALAADRAALASVRAALAAAPQRDTAAMAADWNAALGLPESVAARYRPRLADNALAAQRDSERTLADLRAQLDEREHDLAAARAESERRGDWGWKLDRELHAAVRRGDELDRELVKRSDWARALDAEVERLKPIAAHRDEMLGSRSWRVTRPLRSATTRYRRLRGGLAFRIARIASLRARLRGSLQRRGLIGTLKRIRREFDHAPLPEPIRYRHPQPDDVVAPFDLAASDAPRVSIVIPVYNKIEYTLACLRSLAEHGAAVPFEVIVVDDASSDATAERLAQIGRLRYLRNDENLGFVGSCNRGAAEARGEYVVFLNNDTVVTAGWLDALLACFAERPDAGLVGAKLVYPDGRLQEAGGIVFNDASGWNYGRFENPDDPRFNFRREADYCSGAAIMLPRALFAELGGFDSRYAPAYYEDTDLAFAVRAKGAKVYYEPRSTVIHFEGISAGTDTASGMKRYQVVNQAKFRDKWRDALARQPRPLDEPDTAHLAATHRARKRVLIVDASTPEPDQDSGSLRLSNIMQILGDMGAQVSFLPDNFARFDKYTPALQEAGVEALYAPFVHDLPAFYRRRGREFDLIMVSRHYVAAHHVGLIRAWAPQARFAFDTVDLHYLRERRAAELDPRPDAMRQAEATRERELKLIREADVTLVVSEVEQALLKQDAPGARVEILSNVHRIHGRRNGFDARANLLFVGGFQHPPNVDAMEWFCREVLPLVRRELPEVKLDIVGSKVTPAIEALAGDAVTVHGFVEDLEPMLDGARVSVAPLRYGAGVKGKVNDAMAHGLPVVATPMAVEGIHAVAGEDVLIGADAASFAAEVVRLHRDGELWSRLSDNGLDNVRRQFSFDTARATLEKLLA